MSTPRRRTRSLSAGAARRGGPDRAEGADSVAILYQPPLQATAEQVRAYLAERGFDAHRVEIPDAEAGKDRRSPHSVGMCAGGSGSKRNDKIISLGGGAATDLAGFVAATWMRGIGVIHIPTTLLAMVDAAVGGKTGINTDAGKNPSAPFHEPDAVLIDIATPETVLPNEVIAGMAEVIKTGFIADPVIDLIEADRWPQSIQAASCSQNSSDAPIRGRPTSCPPTSKSHRCGDPQLWTHPGSRHRTARALPLAPRCRRVGRIGVRRELARLAGRLDDETADRHRLHPELIGQPTTYDAGRPGDLMTGMAGDKKKRSGVLRFVVPDGLAKPGRLEGPDPTLIAAAYRQSRD